MEIKKIEFNNSYCIPEVAINEFMVLNALTRVNIINIIPIPNGVELWYWG